MSLNYELYTLFIKVVLTVEFLSLIGQYNIKKQSDVIWKISILVLTCFLDKTLIKKKSFKIYLGVTKK